MSDSEVEPQGEASFEDQLKYALKAFRKRLKLTRLDHESKLGYGPMTNGSNARNSGIVGITPPNQFPQAIWDELTRQGKLKHVGQGLYELTSGT
jgi:hypothetical protein